MKYSQLLGVLACIGQAFVCFMPWSSIADRNLLITGMNAAVPNFGRPGLLHIIFSGLTGLFFIIPAIWAKRFNVVFAAINLAWSIRNYLLMSLCQGGECPEKRAGIYLLVCVAIFILIMTFLPRMKTQSQLK